jgi:uncharacterized protein (TIGR02246 family)
VACDAKEAARFEVSGPEATLHELMVESTRSGDAETLISLYAEDAVLMPPNDTSLYGKDEIRAWFEEYTQWFRVTASVEEDRNVTVAGDQAFERTSFAVVIEPKRRGAEIRDEIRMLIVWRRESSGAWKITHQMWNSAHPVGSGTSRYMSKMAQRGRSR